MLVANVVVDIFLRGGLVMWPILLAMVGALVVIVERGLWWWGLRRKTAHVKLLQVCGHVVEGEFADAVDASASEDDPYIATVHDGLVKAHSSMLGAMQIRASYELEAAERGQWVLGTLITLAPLLGLLGTVTGIMRSFSVVGSEELVPTKVSGGIAEALIATAAGLLIAIVCLLPYNYFNRLAARFRSRLEWTINHTELLVASAKQHGHDLEAFAKARALARTAERKKAAEELGEGVKEWEKARKAFPGGGV